MCYHVFEGLTAIAADTGYLTAYEGNDDQRGTYRVPSTYHLPSPLVGLLATIEQPSPTIPVLRHSTSASKVQRQLEHPSASIPVQVGPSCKKTSRKLFQIYYLI